MPHTIKESYSIESQDLFVLSVLRSKRNGTYLEIGARWPHHASNTYKLEKDYDWRGVGIEWDGGFVNEHLAARKNPCVCADATTLDYDKILTENNLGPHIDYLQVDIEPPSNTLMALKSIDFNKYIFSVITFEHEYGKGEEGLWVREESRKFLEDHGYTRVISDVACSPDHSFEDWYVMETKMPDDTWKLFIGENVLTHFQHIVDNPDDKYRMLFEKYVE